VAAIPAVPGSISGPIGVCRKQQNVLYTISPVYGATSYTWDGPSGSKISSGQGTTSAHITFANSAGNVSVRANNACGSSAYSTLAIGFNCRENVVGKDEQSNDFVDVTAYPNPTSGKLNVSFTASANVKYTLKVVDMIGQTLISQPGFSQEGQNLQELNLSNFAKGIYLVTIEGVGSETRTIRIAVQ
jgi:hypothetical protein